MTHVDNTIRDRLVNIAQFKVTEDYRVYRNGSDRSSANESFRGEYEKNSGMRYTYLGGDGSTLLRSRAIEPPHKAEQEAIDPKMRDQVALTSDNYDFHLEPGNASLNGRDCLILDIAARRKSIYLLNGKAWVDAKTLSLVRIQGLQSLKLSFWAGLPQITRDYEDVNGFPMVIYEEIVAHSYLFGQTTVKIKYLPYNVVREPK